MAMLLLCERMGQSTVRYENQVNENLGICLSFSMRHDAFIRVHNEAHNTVKKKLHLAPLPNPCQALATPHRSRQPGENSRQPAVGLDPHDRGRSSPRLAAPKHRGLSPQEPVPSQVFRFGA